MANIEKKSVREEVSKVKAEFEKLQQNGKVSSEVAALMSSMLMIMELILSIFLERRTRKNSRNSSLPSSQTGKDESTPTSADSKKKGKIENGTIVANTRVKKKVTVSHVSDCIRCGANLEQIPVQGHERRTKIDIVFEKVVDHRDAEIKQCPSCNSITKGKFPADFHGPLQYGNGIKAFMIDLVVNQMVSLNRTQKLVSSMIGAVVAEASILKFIWCLYLVLDDWEKSATQHLLDSKAINVDETSFRVNKQNHWIHVYSSGDVTLKCLHRGRGIKAIESINIIPRYGGVIIHDCWASYLSYKHCEHGLCGSHLLRELKFIVESNNYRWARHMYRLLKIACKLVTSKPEKFLNDSDFLRLQRCYKKIIACGEKELPEIPPRPSGKRGKLAKSDAHNLLERLKGYEKAVLLFARKSYVPFTNNRAERDLRMAKVKQKVSGCFRSLKYAKAYCRISSYLITASNKGYNPLIAIQMALAGKPILE